MSTKHHNLSQLDAPLPSAADMKFGIVVAEWNPCSKERSKPSAAPDAAT